MKKAIVGTIRRRLTAEMLYWELHSLLFMLTIGLKVSKPDREQIEEILVTLEELRIRLEA